jgi:hypothetical protein
MHWRIFEFDDKLEVYPRFIDWRLADVHADLQSVGRIDAAAAIDR